MRLQDWGTIIASINVDITGIVRAQQTLQDIHQEMELRAGVPTEEDFITEDVLSTSLARPQIKIIGGVPVEISWLHRRGIGVSDVKGADLLYEIADRKFAVVQYKVEHGGRVKRDRAQLKDLIDACPNGCPPYLPGMVRKCGAWFAVKSRGPDYYLPACIAEDCFGPFDSIGKSWFTPGLSYEYFEHTFARCLTGAPVAKLEAIRFQLERTVVERDLLLVSVMQRGSFRR
jgi:hypothetical protein